MNHSEATVQIENEEIQNVCLNGFFEQSTQNDITSHVSIRQLHFVVSDNEIIMPIFSP